MKKRSRIDPGSHSVSDKRSSERALASDSNQSLANAGALPESRPSQLTDPLIQRDTNSALSPICEQPKSNVSDVLQAYSALQDKLGSRFTSEQLADVSRAFVLARDAHSTQVRQSGDPYITHPIAVAGIVFDMGLDHSSVMAALMHDVLEDTPVTRDTLVHAFGEEVTHIVDGVSKLNHLKYRSKEEAQAESFVKMLLAMVTDIRVVMIKLGDRLHNMRTIGACSPDKRRRIGKETLQVYAPIASRLGMYLIKSELEVLSFAACYPVRSRVLEATVARLTHHNQILERVIERIQASLSEKGISAHVYGREKHLYSLYKKMEKKRISVQRVFDMLALRILVDDADDCYRTLGIIHQLFPPIFSRFKDYIALPKLNGYQSLHTVLQHGAENTPLEVQIRSRDMHTTAESGIAAHWIYKSDSASASQITTPVWLEKLVDVQQSATDSMEFVESVKIDLFPEEIYVFTPKGRIVQLPRKATPVDFAYAVHSEVGNRCVSAKVDMRTVSLSSQLENGQTVEIITDTNIAISPMWLHTVVTAKARTAIRHYLRAMDRGEAVNFGKRLLKRALGRHGILPEDITDKTHNALLAEWRLQDSDTLYADIGLGNYLPSQIAQRLIDLQEGNEATSIALQPVKEVAPIIIDSASSSALYMARCCRPIPDDNVQGFITPGKGVAVHRAGCRNVRRFRRRPKEWVAVEWAADIDEQFEVVLICHLVHQPGALASVTSTMSLMNVNIEQLDFENRSADDISITFVLSVENRKQLARIVRRLRNLPAVRSVKRGS